MINPDDTKTLGNTMAVSMALMKLNTKLEMILELTTTDQEDSHKVRAYEEFVFTIENLMSKDSELKQND